MSYEVSKNGLSGRPSDTDRTKCQTKKQINKRHIKFVVPMSCYISVVLRKSFF